MSSTRPRSRQHPGILLLAVIAIAGGCTPFNAGSFPRLAPVKLGHERQPCDYEIHGRALPVTPDQPVVVALRPASGDVSVSTGQAVLEQRASGLAPDFLVVPVGHDVAFVNLDSVCHGYFSVSDADPFELPILKPQERAVRCMRQPGLVHVHCRLGGGRQATILVVPSRHFAVASPSGEFAIGGLEPGNWLLETWSGDTRNGPLEVESHPSGAPPLVVRLPSDGGGSM